MRHFLTGAAVAIFACAITAAPAAGEFRGMTADGDSYVLSTTRQLAPADTDSAMDVYLRTPSGDQLVSVGTSAAASGAVVSADGSRVLFSTTDQLDAADTDTESDLYERSGGQTSLITTGPTDPGALPAYELLHVSDDATRVLFKTSASLVAADTDGEPDLYSRAGGVTTLVTPGGSGTHTFVEASADGTRVYELTDEPLVSGYTQSLYLREGGTAKPVFTGTLGSPAGQYYIAGGASRDGSGFVFSTDAKLELGDTNDTVDLYQRRNGRTRLLTANRLGLAPECPISGGGFGPPPCTIWRAGQTADGATAAFGAGQRLVTSDTDSGYDIYVRSGSNVSHVADGGEAWIADDGSRIVFHTGAGLVPADTDGKADLYARVNGQLVLLTPGTPNDNLGFVGASRDLTRVFFVTEEGLVPEDTDTQRDVYQSVNGTIRFVTSGPTDDHADELASSHTRAAPSDDGTSAMFSSQKALTADDTDASSDTYIWQDGVTTLVSD
jgi:hypothetical protein